MFYGNHYLAYVGGVSLGELNLLEAEFLGLLQWKVWVEADTEYEIYLQGVVNHFRPQ